MLAELSTLTNSISGDMEVKTREQGTSTSAKDDLLSTKKVIQNAELRLGGEQGTGGRPLKKKPDNPYLEIDLIDPLDPILFEGEIQKYKPGFKATFIDRWVQVTAKAFRYFVSKPSSDNPVIRPLLAIPISALKSVDIVNYELPIKKGDTKALELAKN